MNTLVSDNQSKAAPSVIIHFCGHIISIDETGRFPKSHESTIQRAVESFFNKNDITSAFGSLAAGADILIAESAIQQGVELNLVFPYPIDSFIKNSVLPSGNHWVSRFNSVLAQANSVVVVYQQQPKDDVLSYAQCSEVAMGLAVLSAIQSSSLITAKQLTVWDGSPTSGIAGSYPDMLRWNSLDLASVYFDTKAISHKQQSLSYPNLPLLKFTNKDKLQSVNEVPAIIAYLEQTEITRMESPQEFLDYDFAKLSSKTWDLDHQVYGQFQQKKNHHMTSRCAGMLAFHLLQQPPNNDKNQLLRVLELINKIRTTSEAIDEN